MQTKYEYFGSGNDAGKDRPQHVREAFGTAAESTTSYTYSSLGRVATITDGDGLVTTKTYDPATGQPDVTTLPGGFTINEDFDWRGDLTAVTDPNGRRTTYAYNKRRQRTGETADAGGIAAASNSTFDNQARVATAYTRNGRVASVSEPSGDTATFPDGTPPTTSSAQVPASGTLVIDLAPLRGLEAKIGYFQPSEARGAA